jgi:hypothetical protein
VVVNLRVFQQVKVRVRKLYIRNTSMYVPYSKQSSSTPTTLHGGPFLCAFWIPSSHCLARLSSAIAIHYRTVPRWPIYPKYSRSFLNRSGLFIDVVTIFLLVFTTVKKVKISMTQSSPQLIETLAQRSHQILPPQALSMNHGENSSVSGRSK